MTATPLSAAPHNAPTPLQLAAFREQLEEQRRFRIEQLEQLDAVPTDDDVAAALAAGARAALHDVLAALHRIDTGSYGACTECGARLPLERLEILPQVGQCLPCRRLADLGAARQG